MLELKIEAKAKFVVQVTLQYKKKNSAVRGALQFWRKDGSFGAADEILRMCAAPNCKGVIRDTFAFTPAEQETVLKTKPETIDAWPPSAKLRYLSWHTQLVACPRCGNLCIRDDLPDSWGFQTTLDKTAELIEDFFRELDSDADIYMVIARYSDGLKKAKHNHSIVGDVAIYDKELKVARQQYKVHYALDRILKDVSSGASLQSRIKAMITA